MANVDPINKDARWQSINKLIQQSTIYSSAIADILQNHNKTVTSTGNVLKNSNGKRSGGQEEAEDASENPKKKSRVKGGKPSPIKEKHVQADPSMAQPSLITGAKLRDYQLIGVHWLASLYENGLNGILADEMGLGKTLQTIAFIAFLKERGIRKPFLVISPLSVLDNWANEFQKFAPSIPVCKYHGDPETRKDMIQNMMNPHSSSEPPSRHPTTKPKGRKSAGGKAATASPAPFISDSPSLEFPVVLTTYEMIIRDRRWLSRYDWAFVIVDEGHRLKNADSKLIRELSGYYRSDHRLILTGTPLHNNLKELWSLLHFILPKIFKDLDVFLDFFADAAATSTADASSSESTTPIIPDDQSNQVISSLHAILKPFLLRRLKVDVETGLPPKKEYVLYAPLTQEQLELYEHVVSGGAELREWIVKKACGITGELDSETKKALQDKRPTEDVIVVDDSDEEEVEAITKHVVKRPKRKTVEKHQGYGEISDDEDYFQMLEDEEDALLLRDTSQTKEEVREMAKQYAINKAFKMVNSLHLKNKVMQLRKVCSHPFLFYWPIDPKTGSNVINDQLMNASGKMLLLNRLLTELFQRKHKVLLFSQFTTMLDLIQDWAEEFKGWDCCRIDGSTSIESRKEQMERFNKGGEGPGACRLFLLSTRAGGLGINLVAADSVIFYDQDWNPQMDLQAQDRAHRIGQTRPVLIFRLVSAHTVETHILERASQKRKLEALVIAKGKFKMPGARAPNKNESTIADMAASLLSIEGEKVDIVTSDDKIISDEDLDTLLDRSPEVFTERNIGWSKQKAQGTGSGDTAATRKKAKGTSMAFKVFERSADEANDGLARMMDDETN